MRCLKSHKSNFDDASRLPVAVQRVRICTRSKSENKTRRSLTHTPFAPPKRTITKPYIFIYTSRQYHICAPYDVVVVVVGVVVSIYLPGACVEPISAAQTSSSTYPSAYIYIYICLNQLAHATTHTRVHRSRKYVRRTRARSVLRSFAPRGLLHGSEHTHAHARPPPHLFIQYRLCTFLYTRVL